MPYYQDPQKALARFHAGHEKLNSYPQTDTSKVAAIGYCFGGTQVLNVARLGEDLKGVVSFHGGLAGVPAKKELLKADILVCHGAADSMVPDEQVNDFKKQLDAIGASYTFKAYEGAKHAFSNPDATENGKKFNLDIAYNAAADTASWAEMKTFFNKIFR
ncbi:MAG TPA: dienelactone hydrolase family protein, partial [Chitinophagaceae bacterium]|nr:dienelactone hydrolase family protein [Chitinophagaceae bacterium]